MKEGRSLQDLAAELERQRDAKRDFIADTRSLSMFHEAREDGQLGRVGLAMADFDEGGLQPSKHCHRQIGARLGIPAKYYDRMLEESPGLLAENVNHWFRQQPEKRMIRTMDGRARAFLSERYRPLDNFDLASAVLPVLQATGANVESCEVTESRLYLKAVLPEHRAEIPPAGVESWEWGKDHHSIDVVEAGLVISNSEIGVGALTIQPGAHTRQCSNLAIFESDKMSKYHVGRALGGSGKEGELDILEYMTDETRAKSDEAIWLQVRDLVQASLTGVVFEAIVARLKDARGHPIEGEIAEVVEVVSERLGLTDGEQKGVLDFLAKGGDMTQYGISNAITRLSQDCDNYDRATELERAGGRIIELPRKEWASLAAAA